MMEPAYFLSYTLLAFWATIGIVLCLVFRDRRRLKKREEETEQQLALWVERERRQGVSATSIAERLDAKREELRRGVRID
ncbi:MAG: hypothetical protein NTW86_16835 [Candidatus Sumerlaeota bacterium]|nr:hypothetical protein [Candidatus Sumerlaeota bacterium]